jgi:dihydrolipoamide dehydrogenase
MVMGSLSQETQLAIVGAGPGGYVAAIRAADLGLNVTLIDERDVAGGTCLLEGCIPSKALINAAELVESARLARTMGINFGEPEIDLVGLRKFKENLVEGLTGGIATLLKHRDVEVIKGRARFTGDRELVVEGAGLTTITFEQAIIATGSQAHQLPDQEALGLWGSREALSLPLIPARLLVVGGGYIGLELGLVYAALGSEITMVLMDPSLLIGADKDLVDVVLKRARKKFKAIHFDTAVKTVTKGEDGTYVARVTGKKGEQELVADNVLVAIGRKPNLDGIGLENLNLEVNERGFLPVNERCQTANPRIYAIGDVVPGPMLAHKASREGKVAAEVIAGKPAAFDNRSIPAVVFTDPELAWTGLTEGEAAAQHIEVTVGRFPLRALGRARTLGRTDGLVKVLAEPSTGRVLGVGIVGPHASDLIAEAALALEMGACLEDLMVTIHPHPTLSEGIMEAAEAAAGLPVHINPGGTKR